MVRRHRESDDVSKTRMAILDAAEQIILEEGYAAVSSRRVASRAGLKSQLIHYYFKTMDDLFIALYKRNDEKYAELLVKAIRSDVPLAEFWRLNTDVRSPRTSSEFVALALHRPLVRAEVAKSAERNRRLQAALIDSVLREEQIVFDKLPPVGIAALMTAVSRLIDSELALGITVGHDEIFEWMEKFVNGAKST
jgi:TetR/AcrR family transcriptional regulator